MRPKSPSSVEVAQQHKMLCAVEGMREQNPMLGLRGVRLGIHLPGLTNMQVRAIFEAACTCAKAGIDVHPKIMIPLTAHNNELQGRADLAGEVAQQVMDEQGARGRLPVRHDDRVLRAAITADQIADTRSSSCSGPTT